MFLSSVQRCCIKLGVVVTGAASWCRVHCVAWSTFVSYCPAVQLSAIRDKSAAKPLVIWRNPQQQHPFHFTELNCHLSAAATGTAFTLMCSDRIKFPRHNSVKQFCLWQTSKVYLQRRLKQWIIEQCQHRSISVTFTVLLRSRCSGYIITW